MANINLPVEGDDEDVWGGKLNTALSAVNDDLEAAKARIQDLEENGTGTPGAPGKSAYELWLDEGNTGTIEDFLTDLGSGASAYQTWLDQGNTGTQQDFLDSLKGAPGSAGAAGATGATGPAGPAGPSGLDLGDRILVGASTPRNYRGTSTPIPATQVVQWIADAPPVNALSGDVWLNASN